MKTISKIIAGIYFIIFGTYLSWFLINNYVELKDEMLFPDWVLIWALLSSIFLPLVGIFLIKEGIEDYPSSH